MEEVPFHKTTMLEYLYTAVLAVLSVLRLFCDILTFPMQSFCPELLSTAFPIMHS